MDKKIKAEVKQSASESPPTISEADNVDTIRDILFGNQMREFDRKFTQLEKNMSSDLDALRRDNINQMDSLKSFIESEISILSSKLANTEQAQIDEMDKLDSTIQKHFKTVEGKISATNDTLDKLSHDSSQKFLKQSQDFATSMSEQMKESRDRMDGHREELSSSKVDKALLSELLNSLALQINNDETTND